MRFRCLAFLEQQVEELERNEQDKMEQQQVGELAVTFSKSPPPQLAVSLALLRGSRMVREEVKERPFLSTYITLKSIAFP